MNPIPFSLSPQRAQVIPFSPPEWGVVGVRIRADLVNVYALDGKGREQYGRGLVQPVAQSLGAKDHEFTFRLNPQQWFLVIENLPHRPPHVPFRPPRRPPHPVARRLRDRLHWVGRPTPT